MDETVSEHRGAGPVRTIRAEVVEGPDRGLTAHAEKESLDVGTADGNDLLLTDTTISRFHFELGRSALGITVFDHGSRNGTFVGPARIKEAVVPPGTLIRAGRSAIRVVDGDQVAPRPIALESLGGLRGRSPAMRQLMDQIQRAAQGDASILIVGESGTGKELIARALHDLGPRSGGPLVTLDCGALSPTLVASELFGHERGAFTGAERQHAGAFERANGGTVFLDEIGELPPALQSNLLGVLERRRMRRVGGTEEIEIDVRVVSATNRDLRSEVNEGTFRLDLYYRIAVVTLRVAPLRERKEDIPILVEHFLREAGSDEPLEELFSTRALAALSAHRWPGNARELRNVVESTLTMGETPELVDVGRAPEGASVVDGVLGRPYKEARGVVLEDFEAKYLAHLFAKSEGNIAQAARLARIDRTYLLNLFRKHQLK